MYIPVDIWFRAFLLTVAVETPIALLLLRRWEPGWPRLLALISFANLASHPAVWFVFSQLLLLGTWQYVVVVEGWAIGIEALFYWVTIRGLPARQAVVVALVANLASFCAGRLLVALSPDLFW